VPNIFKNIANFFKTKSYLSIGQTLSFGDMIQRPTNRDYLDSFEVSFLVHACVDKIAKKVANTKFKLYKIIGRTGSEKIDEVNNHPLLDLLAQVNPFTTKFTMLDLTQTYLELLGNSYWYKARGERSNKILELWALRPDWVTIKEDEKEFIKYYEYKMPNGETQQFDPKDIIHFKEMNPKSSLYGLPTVKPAMDIIRTAVYADKWNMNFFNNSAIPDTLMITETKLTDEERAEFRTKWEDKYKGYKNAHKIGFLDGKVDIKQLVMTMRDMEFSKLDSAITQKILIAFGVPKSILGMQGMNRAEAETQIYAFLSETIEPKIRQMVETLNEFLVPEYGENLYLDFKDPTPENRETLVKEYESGLKNNWLLINEVRDLEGYPPVKGGWDFYLPITMTPAGGSEEKTKVKKVKGITEKQYKEHKKKKEQEFLRRKVMAGKRSLKLKMELKEELVKYFLQNHKKKILKPFTEEQKKKWWEEHNANLTSDEKLFAAFTRRLLKNQESRIKEALESEFMGKSITKKVPDLVDWNIENRIFFELAIPIFTDITERRGTRAANLIGTQFELTNEVVKAIDKKSMLFAEQVNETTREKLKKVLGEGISAGEGVPELSDRVADIFKTRRKYETERIARTEVIDASNSAELEAYKQSEVIEKKEWLAEPDACEICINLSGEVVELDKGFGGGEFDYPPAHPNCRCTILPVVE
jgi:HK97 family phage portal protein